MRNGFSTRPAETGLRSARVVERAIRRSRNSAIASRINSDVVRPRARATVFIRPLSSMTSDPINDRPRLTMGALHAVGS